MYLNKMPSKKELLSMVKRATSKQIEFMIYDFDRIGFYRENKKQTRKYIIECINNCYTTERNTYGCLDSDSYDMAVSVIYNISNN